jgi:hypothetical protein
MKLFNYEEIWLASHGDSTKMLEAFKNSDSGNDFIANQKALVDAFWVSDRHKAEYLGLCALRSYTNYVDNNEVDLSLDLLPPWVPIEVVKENPLVQLTDNKIIFIKEK